MEDEHEFFRILDRLGMRYSVVAQHMGYDRMSLTRVKNGGPVTRRFKREAQRFLFKSGVRKDDGLPYEESDLFAAERALQTA